MSSAADLLQVWEAAKADPYYPAIGKDSQFLVGFLLLATGTRKHHDSQIYRSNGTIAFLLTGIFALNRSIVTLPLLGIPASLAFGYDTPLHRTTRRWTDQCPASVPST